MYLCRAVGTLVLEAGDLARLLRVDGLGADGGARVVLGKDLSHDGRGALGVGLDVGLVRSRAVL